MTMLKHFVAVSLAAIAVSISASAEAQNDDIRGTVSDWTICMRLCYVAYAEKNPPPVAKSRKSKTVSEGATYSASLFPLPTPTGDGGWAWTRFEGCIEKCQRVHQ